MDANDKITLDGEIGGQERTFGSIITELNFDNNLSKQCKFHVVKNYEAIKADGILGINFLQGKTIMDCIENILYCCNDESQKLVEISNNFGLDKPILCTESKNERKDFGYDAYFVKTESELMETIKEIDQVKDSPISESYDDFCFTLRAIETDKDTRPQKKDKTRKYNTQDRNINPKKFKKGQHVWMRNMYRTGKFGQHWVGPYEILQEHNEFNVTIMCNRSRKKVHINRLKLANRKE